MIACGEPYLDNAEITFWGNGYPIDGRRRLIRANQGFASQPTHEFLPCGHNVASIHLVRERSPLAVSGMFPQWVNPLPHHEEHAVLDHSLGHMLDEPAGILHGGNIAQRLVTFHRPIGIVGEMCPTRPRIIESQFLCHWCNWCDPKRNWKCNWMRRHPRATGVNENWLIIFR